MATPSERGAAIDAQAQEVLRHVRANRGAVEVTQFSEVTDNRQPTCTRPSVETADADRNQPRSHARKDLIARTLIVVSKWIAKEDILTKNPGNHMPTYLRSDALTSACRWLHQSRLPANVETADEMIATYYPGGLHWFIAQHLVSPQLIEDSAPD